MRLRLGIVYVGTIVLAVTALLAVDLSGNVALRTWEARHGMFTGVGLLVGLFTLLALPFDVVGGYLLPKAFDREVTTFPRFLASLLKGVANHAGFYWLVGSGYILAAQLGGWILVPFIAMVFLFQQIIAQKAFAGLVGEVSESASATEESRVLPISELSSQEPSFSGGIVGWPGLDRLVMAADWRRQLEPGLYELVVGRRIAAVELGLRRRGVLIAGIWNLLGVFGAAYFTGMTGTTLAELIDFACISTLWSFVGLLILPSLSRSAVAEIDRQILSMGYSREELGKLARVTSEWQDGETRRPEVVETIFHPLPSVENRTAALDRGIAGWAAWNAARMTLYLSWSALGLLSRAVHSNAGRPDLWVMGAVD